MIIESIKLIFLKSLPLWVGAGLWVHFKNLDSNLLWIATTCYASLAMTEGVDSEFA